jgi:NAD(P)-dependent dehydrogenase (short-subunit alcohol dehydrogenase family)
VTGASRGIGRVVASHLTEAGYRVAIAARSGDGLAAVARETGAFAVSLDVTDGAAVEAAFARVDAELGPLDLLVANAGVGGDARASWDQQPDDWWRVFEVNVLGAYLCTRAAVPRMRSNGGGRIVNIASGAAYFPLDRHGVQISSAYMASKAALMRFTEALAAEAAADGIAVFAISPGTVKTEMTADVFEALWDEPGIWSPPELAAELIAFLDTGALDALSGRYIHAAIDDWRSLPDRIDEILEGDRHALRLR